MSNKSMNKADAKGMPMWAWNLIAGVIAVLLVIGLVFQILSTSGVLKSITLHASTAVESENYKLNGSDFTYLYSSAYTNYVYSIENNYGSEYLSYFGLDTSKSLDSQKYPQDETKTWRDHFISEASSNATNYLVMAEAAKAAGIELGEEENAAVAENIANLKEAAKTNGYSISKFIKNYYGKGVKLADVEKVEEISQLAAKYYNQIYNGFTYTQENYDKQYDDNKNDYLYADYYSYEFPAEFGEGATDEQQAEAAKNALAKAEAFKKSIEDGADMVKLVYDFKIEIANESADNAKAKLDEAQKAYDEADKNNNESEKAALDEAQQAYDVSKTAITGITEDTARSSMITTDASYSDTDLGNWLFGSTPPEAGELKLIESDGTSTVYQVVTKAHRLDYKTVSFYQLALPLDEQTQESEDESVKTAALAELKSTADALINDFNAGTDKSGEAFKNLKEKNDKLNATDLQEKVGKSSIEEADKWFFDEERKPGDTTAITVDDQGVMMLYFVGYNEEKWIVDVDKALRDADYESKYNEFKEKYTVTINDKTLSKVGME